MMRVIVCAVLVWAFGMVSGSSNHVNNDPSPCSPPQQWKGRASQYNHSDSDMNRYVITYDGPHTRKVISEELHASRVIPGRRFYKYLILNNVNKMYKINIKTKECTSGVPPPWKPFSIPANATYEGQYTIGGPSESITAVEWSDRVPYRKTEEWIGSYSQKDCYPIRAIMFPRGDKAISNSVTTNFYDISTGIPDPSVFVPPKECDDALHDPSLHSMYWL